jgi:hypothetical protein
MAADASTEAHPAVAPAVDTIHVGFGSHHVVVRSASPQVAAALRTLLGPMVIRGPVGTPAGQLDAIPDNGRIRIVGAPDATEPLTVEPDWAPRELYHATLKLLMLARQDLVWIHAGVAAYEDRAYLFAGPSGQGKSTLVGALIDRGWAYFSDEIAAIDCESGTVHPFPLAPHRRVHDGEFVLLEPVEAVRGLRKVAVEFPSHAVGQRPLLLERLCILRYAPETNTIHEAPCTPAQAVLELLDNSLNITSNREREIAFLAQLVSRVPAVQISYPSAVAAAATVHSRAVTRTAAT